MQGYYTHPNLFVAKCPTGRGLFTHAPIQKGEVIANWAPMWAHRMSRKEAFQYAKLGNHYIMQADDRSYFVSLEQDKTDYINHSCEPNIGLNGPTEFVAMRDIKPGEEITFDYAISESDPLWTMQCHCGKPSCRKVIRGTDWKNPELQKRYGQYFSDHIQKKIRWNPAQRLAHNCSDFFSQKLHNLRWWVKKAADRS